MVDKYKLPMVPLDVCQGDILLDVEQCIPGDFVNTFPSDTLLEVCIDSPEAARQFVTVWPLYVKATIAVVASDTPHNIRACHLGGGQYLKTLLYTSVTPFRSFDKSG